MKCTALLAFCLDLLLASQEPNPSPETTTKTANVAKPKSVTMSLSLPPGCDLRSISAGRSVAGRVNFVFLSGEQHTVNAVVANGFPCPPVTIVPVSEEKKASDIESLLALLSKYIGSNDEHRALMERSLTPLFSLYSFHAQRDRPEIFSKLLETGRRDWVEGYIGMYGSLLPLRLEPVFETPTTRLSMGQRSARRFNVCTYSDGVGEHTLRAITGAEVWDWWMYKSARKQDESEELERINQVAGRTNGDFACAALISDQLHVWRRGHGIFLVLSRKRGEATYTITYPEEVVEESLMIQSACRSFTHTQTQVKPDDLLVYLSEEATFEIERARLLTVEDGMNPAGHFSEVYRQAFHGSGARLEVFQVSTYPIIYL